MTRCIHALALSRGFFAIPFHEGSVSATENLIPETDRKYGKPNLKAVYSIAAKQYYKALMHKFDVDIENNQG